MPSPSFNFPPEFVWGSASSAFQIEGATNEDGRGPSVWDDFVRRPGAIHSGRNADVSCDFYHRFPDDIKLMAELGLGAYRLSLSWPRILPDGTGRVETRGLDFYDRVVDEMLAAHVDPWICLHHWDLPSALHRRGGWLAGDSSRWFAEIAEVAALRLGDRVKNWITFNEPQCFVGDGYFSGVHAPGLRLAWDDVRSVARNVMLAHGRAAQALRSSASGVRVGIAPVGVTSIPVEGAVEAAREASFAQQPEKCWTSSYWLDPMIHGRYLDPVISNDPRPQLSADDLQVINQPLDFLGLNLYSGDGPGHDGEPGTAMHWPIRPESLYWSLRFHSERYAGIPMYVSENGMANLDWVHDDGAVHDPQRIDFISQHLRQVERAIEEGVDVHGYFYWTFTDNFEWHLAYTRRFGLVHVDFETRKRTPKDSFWWFRDVVGSTSNSE